MAILVDIFGSFAEPLLNMALDNGNLKYAWKKYFTALKLSWKDEFPLALREINEGLSLCQKDKTLYYLLLSRKLHTLMGMKDSRGDLIYVNLMKNESKIPFAARKYVMPILLNYRPIRKIEEGVKKLRKTRTWSEKYVDDRRTQIFLLLGKAREKVEIGKVSEGFSLFLKSFRIASHIPHPLGITDALNDMAWYMRSQHPRWAYEIAKKAVYCAGWYKEDVASVFYTFDTLFECQQIINHSRLYKSANVMILSVEHLPHGTGRETQERYYDRINFCERITPKFETSEYENSKSLREYLKIHMRSATRMHTISGVGKANILSILNGRVKKVRGDTLRKFVRALKLNPSPDNCPFPIWNEYVKVKTEEDFLESVEKLKKIKNDQRQIDLITTYMAYLNRRKSLPYLSQSGKLEKMFTLLENLEKFKDFTSKSYERMEFVHNMVNEMYPFFQARKDLAQKFIKRMSNISRDIFIERYVKMYANRPFIVENDREAIDKFVRNYIRYDIKWGINLRSVKSTQSDHTQRRPLERFIQIFHLRKMPAVLAYYALENENEKKRLLRVLKKF